MLILCNDYFNAFQPTFYIFIMKNELWRRPRVSALDLLGPVI